MPNVRFTTAILVGKLAGFASRTLGRGGGTTVPGVVARRVDPHILRRLSSQLREGVVVVAGTNGKTTTTRMLSSILEADQRPPLHNRAGANLLSGLTSTAVAGSSWFGQPTAAIGLFETDEAALPDVIAETQPRLVLLHNLFRDQLDRYGEVDTIAKHWRKALETLPATSTVLLNADDPAIAALGSELAPQVRYYGLDDTRHASDATRHIADSQFCRRCGAPYAYTVRFYAHVGHYHCPQCGQQRPNPDYQLARLDLAGDQGSRLFMQFEGGALELQLPIPGLYNALNALAATAAAHELGVKPQLVRNTLEQFSAAFGRIERIDAQGKPMLVALIKNPVGASETMRMLTNSRQNNGQPLHLLIAINDKHADGTDVSWLWDADFEQLNGQIASAVVSGTRAEDMAVRLKYACIDPAHIVVAPQLANALDQALAQLPANTTLYTLPTYTAMLELRAELAQRGWVKQFWED
jgi:UDP-N-acetylmuramyl tripeptide synthase